MIQSALTMLHAGEWTPVTAARILAGIFFCISGGTKLFVRAQFGCTSTQALATGSGSAASSGKTRREHGMNARGL